MNHPMIEFRNFSFRYRTQTEPSLREIELTVERGEKVLIAGASGSGKSTLGHCINGLIPCSYQGQIQGTLLVDGLEPKKAGIFGMSKKVGTVLQDTNGQFIGMTVAEDIAFALENDETEPEQMKKKVLEAAAIVEMQDYLQQSPEELSGGQKQRVAMGDVLVDDVEILLFDEPLANLDPATGKRTIELIDKLNREKKKTVLIIEHRLEDVLFKPVDRVVLIDEGKIVCNRSSDEILCSDILKDYGIREPLYISALKYAGCRIVPEDHPSSVDTMELVKYRDRIRSWFVSRKKPVKPERTKEILSIRNLSFSYTPGERVLKNISLSVYQGELIAIVGKNGAGKSTLASLICGFVRPDEGEILLEGEDIAPLSISERGERIGFVMQDPNQMISRPMILDETALGLVSRGVPKEEAKKKAEEALKICGLYPYRNWPVSALSFGQKKRVTIASILCLNPKLLILDEPTAGQDYRHYTAIMEFIKRINEETGITIIMITHDMHLMLEYTDRAIVLTKGELKKDDTPARILTDEKLSEEACLKKTSLYDLAHRCGIEEADDFTERFIACEREQNEKQTAVL